MRAHDVFSARAIFVSSANEAVPATTVVTFFSWSTRASYFSPS
jgi:hypothetical protein